MCHSSIFTSVLGDVLFSVFGYLQSGEFILEQCIKHYLVESPLFLGKGHYFSYYIMLIAMQGIRVAFYALLSLGISVFLRNKFVILSLPVVLYYLVINFTYYIIEFLKMLDPYIVYQNFQLFSGNEIKCIITSAFISRNGSVEKS